MRSACHLVVMSHIVGNLLSLVFMLRGRPLNPATISLTRRSHRNASLAHSVIFSYYLPMALLRLKPCEFRVRFRESSGWSRVARSQRCQCAVTSLRSSDRAFIIKSVHLFPIRLVLRECLHSALRVLFREKFHRILDRRPTLKTILQLCQPKVCFI